MSRGPSPHEPPSDATPVDGAGRFLATPGRFTRDDGAPDLRIRQAGDVDSLLAALARGRLLVALVATTSEADTVTGEDKSSDMSVVSMVAGDGRKGLLVFSGVDALHLWDPGARPVPVAGPDAAQAALEQGCEALIIDVAGPRRQVVTEADVVALAGVNPRDYAQPIAQRSVDAALGPGRALVVVDERRLRVHAPGVDPRDIAAGISTRVLALTAVEIVEE